jgi:hypothetical protein
MAQLPNSEPFRDSVSEEVRRQFVKSIAAKLALLMVAVAALAVVLALDALKSKFRETREKPYSAVAILSHSQDTELRLAAAKLAKKKGQYATPDDAFTALLAETPYAADLAKEQQKTRERYEPRIDVVDRDITAVLTAESPADEKTAKTNLDGLKARRADLVAARTAALAEAEQRTAAKTASLRRTFDESKAAELGKATFNVSPNKRLNDFAKHIVDPDHPLSILYDVLWYASLVVGVLALVTLLLTPLFRALPVAGANDKFMDQIKGLFSRAPRALGSGIMRVAAMSIGAATIVGVATTAPSSPLYGSGLMPTRIEQQVVAEPNPPEVPAKPVPEKTDPRIETLLTEVGKLQAEKEAQEKKLQAHEATLQSLEPVPIQIATLAGDAQAQREDVQVHKQEVRETFGTVNAAITTVGGRAESADLKAEFAQKKAAEVGEQVEVAKQLVVERAASIEDGVYLPYKLGERPAALKSVLGFDRYRITAASGIYVRKAGAPAEVVDAVTSMESDTILTNDALRLSLRRRVCGAESNCRTYVEWRGTVLRAARLQ